MDRNIAPGTVPLAQGAVAPASGGTPGLFADPDPTLGIPPTECPPWFLNMVMEEIRNVVLRADLTPSSTYWAQLADAITIIAQSVTGAAGPFVRQGNGVGQASDLVNIGRSLAVANKLKATIEGGYDLGNIAFESWVTSGFAPLANPMWNSLYFISNGTWTVPAGVYNIRFTVVGGGGAGGAGNSGQYSGGGGGGGGTCVGIASVVPGNVLNMIIGAGGLPGVTGATSQSGGPSHIAGIASGFGGNGGGSNSPFSQGGRGGTGAIISGANAQGVSFAGGDGTDGLAPAAVSALGGQCFMGGNGGSSYVSGGGRAGNGGGLAGQDYGSGGGGSYGSTAPGGAGASGLVIIEW